MGKQYFVKSQEPGRVSTLHGFI